MFVNSYNHQRGTICVIREVGGQPVALAIAMPDRYKEWRGCFSIL